jgi:phage-related protein
VKEALFLGSTYDVIMDLPKEVRSEIGFQLREVQKGNEPEDWKPMPTVGAGVRELRVRHESGAYRAIYVLADTHGVLVLHVFQKKTQKTPKKDLQLAAARLREWKGS